MVTYLAETNDLALKLGVDASDPLLLLALRRATDRFRGDVGHAVTVTSESIVLDGDGTDTLILPAAPVNTVTTVTVGGTTVTDYTFSRILGVLRRRGFWPDDLGNVQVTYTHGYDVTPGDVADAVLEQAELQYRTLVGVQATATGERSVTYGVQATVGVTQRWSDAVDRYRINRGDHA